MAEVKKNKKVKDAEVKEKVKKETKKVEKKEKKEVKKPAKAKVEKKSLWVRFRIFCHGVKSEFQKVHWPSKKEMVNYSIATVAFIVFCALFFLLINIIFAFVQTLFH